MTPWAEGYSQSAAMQQAGQALGAMNQDDAQIGQRFGRFMEGFMSEVERNRSQGTPQAMAPVQSPVPSPVPPVYNSPPPGSWDRYQAPGYRGGDVLGYDPWGARYWGWDSLAEDDPWHQGYGGYRGYGARGRDSWGDGWRDPWRNGWGDGWRNSWWDPWDNGWSPRGMRHNWDRLWGRDDPWYGGVNRYRDWGYGRGAYDPWRGW